jgi:hypothetical protein
MRWSGLNALGECALKYNKEGAQELGNDYLLFCSVFLVGGFAARSFCLFGVGRRRMPHHVEGLLE